MTSRLGTALLSLLLLLPLAAGAAVAGIEHWRPVFVSSPTPGAAPGGDQQRDAQPGSAAGSRRALGEAQFQAGLLTQGTKQLTQGTQQFTQEAPKLADATGQAAQGANQLRDGLVQLQAGTGQLGDGATQLADGVGQAVDNVVGINVVRGQILTAIDSTLTDIKDNKSPEAADMRRSLGSLRTQVETFEIDSALLDRLKELKSGSRELSNQLDVPGYAYHDGVYQATEGAKKLASGLAELNAGVDEALANTDKLHEGAEKIDTLAKNTKTKVDAAAGTAAGARAAGAAGANGSAKPRAAAAATRDGATGPAGARAAAAGAAASKTAPTGVDSSADSSAETTADSQALLERQTRGIVTLLAALALLGGVAVGAGWAATTGARKWILAILGTAAVVGSGLIGLMVLDMPGSLERVALSGAALLLTCLAASVGTRIAQRVCGASLGLVLAVVLGLAQFGFVAWLWQESVDFNFTAASWFGAFMVPLNWSVAALYGASGGYLWTCLSVLGAVTVMGMVLIARVRRGSAPSARVTLNPTS